jgi:RNA polymerase sigma-70 factor (ECF subfamily)
MTNLVFMEGRNRMVELTGTEDRREAFARLAVRELGSAYRLAARLVGPADAEDAVNDAVLRAWNGFDSLRDRDKFHPWLAQIVVNTCRNVLERRRTVTIAPIGDLEPEAADQLGGRHTRDALDRALGCLSPAQRISIVLRYWNDLSVDEIASLTRVPSGTVKWRLHSACKRLRLELEKAGWED